jgi:hypothetical protein
MGGSLARNNKVTYRTVAITMDPAEIPDFLNTHYNAGWELVTVVHYPACGHVWIFKRRANAS